MKKYILTLGLILAMWYNIDSNTQYMLVPGGWIYKYETSGFKIGDVHHTSMVFVPFYHKNTTPSKPR